ncbi:DUF3080 family protein [Aliiglaciecola sp. M165]|uniref:DUF3080 family protein n=1 Tax=Aliiglaciecola sp. M165 TaxID=2593649 RepID=UPI0011801DE5|nr:DUF3080 family protein [Aliiglaciecola sp. M165]TRY32614.1 DUF3080 domain-containing protein [Aliiglaciecola sp. M165]
MTGCTRAPIESHLKDYAGRLSNVLGQPIVLKPSTDTLRFPAAVDLRVTIPEITINLREFYALDNCEVSTLIAQRNTALGKTQLPSTRYVYEVNLIDGLQQCLAQADEPNQRQALTQWLTQKSSNVQRVWADMLQNSSEIKQTLTDNQGYFTAHSDARLAEYKTSWHYIISLYQHHEDVDAEKLENALNFLRQNPLFARLWRTQSLLSNQLEQLNEQLLAIEPNLLCDSASNQQQAEYLKNVFQLFFIDRIQPFAAQLDQNQYALRPIIDSLQDNSDISEALRVFLNARQQSFLRYQNSVLVHVKFWQRLFTRCDLSPN